MNNNFSQSVKMLLLGGIYNPANQIDSNLGV